MITYIHPFMMKLIEKQWITAVGFNLWLFIIVTMISFIVIDKLKDKKNNFKSFLIDKNIELEHIVVVFVGVSSFLLTLLIFKIY